MAIVLILALLFLLVSIALIFRRLWSSPNPAAPVEPTCGHCGYCVRGLPGLVCPECGSDLREVGILTQNLIRKRRHVSRAVLMILWTLAIPVPALLISVVLLETVLPYSQTLKIQRMIFCQALFLNTTLQLSGEQRLWQPVLLHQNPTFPQTVQLFDQQHATYISIDLKSGAFSYVKKDGTHVRQPSGFSGAALADWLSSPTVSAGDQRLRDLCDAVCLAINEIPQGSARGFTPLLDRNGQRQGIAHPAFAFVVHDEPHWAVIAGLALCWLLIWIYGIRRIQRASRR